MEEALSQYEVERFANIASNNAYLRAHGLGTPAPSRPAKPARRTKSSQAQETTRRKQPSRKKPASQSPPPPPKRTSARALPPPSAPKHESWVHTTFEKARGRSLHPLQATDT